MRQECGHKNGMRKQLVRWGLGYIIEGFGRGWVPLYQRGEAAPSNDGANDADDVNGEKIS